MQNWKPAKSAFVKMRKISNRRDRKIPFHIQVHRCYDFSVYFSSSFFLYNTEPKRGNGCIKLKAFEMWMYNRLLKISWITRHNQLSKWSNQHYQKGKEKNWNIIAANNSTKRNRKQTGPQKEDEHLGRNIYVNGMDRGAEQW